MNELVTAIRRYRKSAAMEAVGYFSDGPMFVPNYVLRVLRVLVLLSIWRMVLAGRGEVSGMGLGAVLTYTLVSEMFAEPFACRTSMPWELDDGVIATRFLRPMRIFGQYISETVGRWSVSFLLFSIPLFALAPLLGVNPLPHSPANAVWFAVSVPLAVAVGMAIESIFCAMVILLEYGVYSVNCMREAATVLLSGSLLPLALLPRGLGHIFSYLPFASMASAPLRIYTGTGNALQLVSLQLGWAATLWLAASIAWRSQRERLVTHGG